MIDLNKARAARKREAKREPVVVKIGTDVLTLPLELSFEVALSLAGLASVKDDGEIADVITKALQSLFGQKQYATFMGHNPSMSDIMALITALVAEYGIGLGESKASRKS